MMDMMHSTTAVVLLAIFLLVIVAGVFVTFRVLGERVRTDEEKTPRTHHH